MRVPLLIILLMTMLVWSCNQESTTGSDENLGRINLFLTDAPAAYDSVIIHFTQVSAHIDSDWVTIKGDPISVDLLEWQNGRTLLLGSADVPAGKYTQVRIKIDSAKIGVKGSVFPLDVPSGAKTGLKFGPQFTIASGSTYELVMDFDACRSIVTTGPKKNPTGYKLKPRIRVIPSAVSGSISGRVTNPRDMPLAHAILNNDTITSSYVDTLSGEFALAFLPGATYKVAIEDTMELKYEELGVVVEAGQNQDLGDITLQ